MEWKWKVTSTRSTRRYASLRFNQEFQIPAAGMGGGMGERRGGRRSFTRAPRYQRDQRARGRVMRYFSPRSRALQLAVMAGHYDTRRSFNRTSKWASCAGPGTTDDPLIRFSRFQDSTRLQKRSYFPEGVTLRAIRRGNASDPRALFSTPAAGSRHTRARQLIFIAAPPSRHRRISYIRSARARKHSLGEDPPFA